MSDPRVRKDGQCARKLCECGCGEPAPIAKVTNRRKGHIKGEPIRFVNGHNQRGIPKSPEHRAKIAAYARNMTKEHRARLSEERRRRPLAAASEITSGTIHQWLERNYPKAGVCEGCGLTGKTDRAFLRHPEPHTRNPDDYVELCRRCHTIFDVSSGIRPHWSEVARGRSVA